MANAAQVVGPGQEVTVKVLRVEADGQKIALGLKQLSPDPWATVPARMTWASSDQDADASPTSARSSSLSQAWRRWRTSPR